MSASLPVLLLHHSAPDPSPILFFHLCNIQTSPFPVHLLYLSSHPAIFLGAAVTAIVWLKCAEALRSKLFLGSSNVQHGWFQHCHVVFSVRRLLLFNELVLVILNAIIKAIEGEKAISPILQFHLADAFVQTTQSDKFRLIFPFH